ncbi:hypothetical protein C7H85_08470 [Zobellella endophytica]|uniref:DUF481 domain-containing protein n=1 Tax=Zobellella endophytica TaxID=2116700 RepID=A0A2P7R8X6_9GAMM|nr:hypothetical protein [Zobellella endophytica]PSJ46640.1 hypothetical protein C7H85_08470 [Zobellella endophytica]
MRTSYLAATLAIFAGLAQAQHDDDTDLPRWAVDKMTPMHDAVSHWVSNTSRNIDGFFGTDDSLHVENGSYLRLSQELEWNDTENFSAESAVRFRLDLPTTKERLRLIIESDPEESQGTLAEQGSNRLRTDQRGTGSTVIGLSRLGRGDKTREWDVGVGAGVKFRLPLDPYARITGERLWQLDESPWQLASYNRASWFNEDGYSVRSKWDLGRPLDEHRHLRFVTNVQWQETVDTLEYSEAVELNQILGRRSVIRYAVVAVGQSASDPRLHDYYLLSHYRRNLHRELLFLDVIPELHFPREQDYEPQWGLTLRLEVLFRGDLVVRR